MARLTSTLFLSAALASATFAAETPAASSNIPEPALPAALAAPKAPDTSAPTAARARPVSPSVARILQAQTPKYDPEVRAAAERGETPGRLPESQPANGIIRLPEMVVREDRPPVFKEYQIYTKKGLAEVAYKRYITSEVDRALNRFTIPLFGMSAYERALQMYREDERLRNIAETTDLARIVSLTDPEAGMYVKRVSEQTYMRTSDFGYQGGKSPTSNR